MKLSELLAAARANIATEEQCISAAIEHVAAGDDSASGLAHSVLLDAIEAIRPDFVYDLTDTSVICEFNDDASHSEVLRAFDIAIERAKAAEAKLVPDREEAGVTNNVLSQPRDGKDEEL